jgi:hypothetical protein
MMPYLGVQMDGTPLRVLDGWYLHLGFHVDFQRLI